MTTPLTDTRAALEAAIDALIDAKNIDTRAAIAAERGESSTFWKTESNALMRRTELRSAITAHVAAEVARALAAAAPPGVGVDRR